MSSRADVIEYLIQTLFRSKGIGQGTREKHKHKREVYKNYIHVSDKFSLFYIIDWWVKGKEKGEHNHITHTKIDKHTQSLNVKDKGQMVKEDEVGID